MLNFPTLAAHTRSTLQFITAVLSQVLDIPGLAAHRLLSVHIAWKPFPDIDFLLAVVLHGSMRAAVKLCDPTTYETAPIAHFRLPWHPLMLWGCLVPLGCFGAPSPWAAMSREKEDGIGIVAP